MVLDSIQKLFEKYAERCELHETEEVGGMILPRDQEPTLPLKPDEEALGLAKMQAR